MAGEVIVIGASAGGLEALRILVAELPRDFTAAVFAVIHISPEARSALPEILQRSCEIPVRHATHGMLVEPGTVTVAVPDQHLLLLRDRVRLSRGPRDNRHRPAIDPLFRTAARWYGPRATGVVLSGALDDGTSGLGAIHRGGGYTMAQSINDALYSSMPASAIAHVPVDVIGTAAELGRALVERVRRREKEPAMPTRPVDPGSPEEQKNAVVEDEMKEELQGPASSFTCPDCHGALWELQEGDIARYRCRVGHAFSSDSLFAGQSDSVEEALWMAYRALEESANIARRLAERSELKGLSRAAARYVERATDAMARAAVIRALIDRGQIAHEMSHDRS